MHGDKQYKMYNLSIHNVFFVIAKLSIRKPDHGTDEDPGIRIKSFAIVKIRGVSASYTFYKCQSACKLAFS